MTESFFTALLVMLAAAAACGWVTRRLGLTRTVGELLAGVLLGSAVLGELAPALQRSLLPAEAMPSIALFGLTVVLIYVAQTGSELDEGVFAVRTVTAVTIAASALAIALASAIVLHAAFPELAPSGMPPAAFVLFATAALLVTAVPVLARILDEAGLTRTYIGSWAITLAIHVDVVAFTIAAVATSLATGLAATVAAGPLLLVVLLVACRAAAPRVAAIERSETRVAVQVGALVLALAAASLTEASTLVAAFIVGAALWRRIGDSAPGGAAGALLVRALVPVYIVYSGLAVDVGVLGQLDLLGAAALVLLLAIGGKALASLVAARVLRFDRRETVALAVLANTRGLTELILISLGHQAGILSDEAYSVFFLMTVVTTAASGALAGWVARGGRLAGAGDPSAPGAGALAAREASAPRDASGQALVP